MGGLGGNLLQINYQKLTQCVPGIVQLQTVGCDADVVDAATISELHVQLRQLHEVHDLVLFEPKPSYSSFL